MTAADAQLIEQLRFTAETVASAFGVPLYMIGIGPLPTYHNIEALQGQSYAQCLQAHIEAIEVLLYEGLGLGPGFGNQLGVEFDLDGLLRMDTATKVKAAADALKSGALAPNGSPRSFFHLPPTEGGEVRIRKSRTSVGRSCSALRQLDAGHAWPRSDERGGQITCRRSGGAARQGVTRGREGISRLAIQERANAKLLH